MQRLHRFQASTNSATPLGTSPFKISTVPKRIWIVWTCRIRNRDTFAPQVLSFVEIPAPIGKRRKLVKRHPDVRMIGRESLLLYSQSFLEHVSCTIRVAISFNPHRSSVQSGSDVRV
jgi:hypothetical protein